MPPDLTSKLRPLEESHLLPATRADRNRLAAILHQSFTEIGASGRTYTRDEIRDELPSEPTARRVLEDFQVRSISECIALTTYTVTNTTTSRRTRRSSIWLRENNTWQLVSHQGTPH